MTDFIRRLTRAPLAHDTAAGADVGQRFADLRPELRALLVGTAGCSPFLKALIEREEVWLREALAQSGDEVKVWPEGKGTGRIMRHAIALSRTSPTAGLKGESKRGMIEPFSPDACNPKTRSHETDPDFPSAIVEESGACRRWLDRRAAVVPLAGTAGHPPVPG